MDKIERETQNRSIELLWKELDYHNLGNWEERDGNSNIENGIPSAWLTSRGYSQNLR
jgi:type I restriction enzyme R subunit